MATKANTGFQGFMRNHSMEIGATGTGLGLAGGVMDAVSTLRAGKTQKAAAFSNAQNIRKQSTADFNAALADERVMRKNQNVDMGSALAARAAMGLTSQGTGSAGEVTLAQQYEHAIGVAAAQRENARRSAEYEAQLQEWQGKMAQKAAKRSAIGGLVQSVGKAAAGFAGLGMA